MSALHLGVGHPLCVSGTSRCSHSQKGFTHWVIATACRDPTRGDLMQFQSFVLKAV